MAYRRLADTKKTSFTLPVYLWEKLRVEAARLAIPVNSLVIQLLDKHLAKIELPPLPEAKDWPSGWPKSVKCNRCAIKHDPMEHQINVLTNAVEDAKTLG